MWFMNRFKLGDQADINSGYTFRVRIDSSSSGVAVVQAKNVKDLVVDIEALDKVNQDLSKEKLLKKGDVLLSSRGVFRATVFNSDIPTVASSSVLVIRPTSKDYLPEFIALYLNSKIAQAYIRRNAIGATIRGIRLSDLRGLRLPVVSSNVQRKLVAIQQNVSHQHDLLKRKQEVLNSLLNQVIISRLEGAK